MRITAIILTSLVLCFGCTESTTTETAQSQSADAAISGTGIQTVTIKLPGMT